MKKIACLLIAIFSFFAIQLIFAQQSYAQFFSVGGGIANSRYFGKRADYPLQTPKDYPHTFGLKLRGSYGGFGDRKNALNASFTYFFPTKSIDLQYGGATLRGKAMELEINYLRYLRGRYIDDALNVYAIGGFSGTINTLDYNVPAPELIIPGEQKYFKDETTLFGYFNIGIGAEYPVGELYVFLEGKAAIHLNAYVSNTTIWQNNLMYWGGGTFGVRYPLLPKRPRNR
ncbi:hypothetical protein [Thermoflexibacter ruber]|uniref:Outer membrane protein beta-barrel domain-containing protein n=1 Tax=Thermoflexibacter ruber TaxID=1003 RepID=A0A1I2H0U4_9BACT|nr:hypothetical protein [Thermoflexibacter ruber]SFF23695.1 hypothetical protein SAMN04488541_102150 [Thermoflexibacter ruber]